ncbi:antigen-presenting glycoprotein CD1d-like [Lithobates pipiens]
MKGFLPSMTLSIYLFLSFTAIGSNRLNWLQTYQVSDGELSYWSIMEMEGFQLAATYNKPALVYKQSWAKGNTSHDYWSLFDVFLNKYFSVFKEKILQLQEMPDLKDKHTVQCWIGCPSSLEEIEDFTYKVALNGKNEVHLDVIRKVWVGENNPFAQTVQKLFQEDEQTMGNLVVYVTSLCIKLAELFSQAGEEVFSRKIQPQVYITSQPDQSETEVICMVTGFYPKSIHVSLWKENKMEDAMSTDTLPNGDGTYQIKVSTTVNDIKQQSVYCRVEHGSLKEPLIVYLDKEPHFPTGLIIGIAVLVAFCAFALVFFIMKYKKC